MAPHRSDSPSSHTKEDAAELNVQTVVYAGHEITAHYASLHREELVGKHLVDALYVCRHCFKYTAERVAFVAHETRFCAFEDAWRSRTKQYEDNRYSVFSVDGAKEPLFAQNLSLFAKLFIENKSICFDVASFTYHLLIDRQPLSNDNRTEQYQVIGFFSKEKLSWDNNNLACILVFPPWQGQGHGQRLMALSYRLSKKEGILGGPERPLSDQGKRSYEAYWSKAIALSLLEQATELPSKIKIKDLVDDTFIVPEDLVNVLATMNITGKKRGKSITVDRAAVMEWLFRNRQRAEPVLSETGFKFSLNRRSALGRGVRELNHFGSTRNGYQYDLG